MTEYVLACVGTINSVIKINSGLNLYGIININLFIFKNFILYLYFCLVNALRSQCYVKKHNALCTKYGILINVDVNAFSLKYVPRIKNGIPTYGNII